MKSILVHVLILLRYSITLSLAISMSMPNCQEKCGNVTIPYPFGIGSNCSANSSFTVICRNSTTPFLSSINMEVLNISIRGTVIVKPVLSPMTCSANLSTGHLLTSLKESPFTISARYNTLAVSGCKNSVWLQANETTTIGGCTSMCAANSTETSCNGVNCCQTTLPPRLKELEYKYRTIEAISDDSSCGFVLPVEKIWLTNHYKSFKALNQGLGFAPLVLEWEFGELKGYTNRRCRYSDDYCLSYPDDFGRRYAKNDSDDCRNKHFDDLCSIYPSHYYCQSSSDSSPYLIESNYARSYSIYYSGAGGADYASSTKYCLCPRGYVGNPYLPEKCIDINECTEATRNPCPETWSCKNLIGDYDCINQTAKYKAHLRTAFISIGSSLGALILLLVAWRSTKAIRKRIKANRRHKFFKRNGGLLLEQQLSATDNGLDKTRLYSSKELTLATDHYNENRILG